MKDSFLKKEDLKEVLPIKESLKEEFYKKKGLNEANFNRENLNKDILIKQNLKDKEDNKVHIKGPIKINLIEDKNLTKKKKDIKVKNNTKIARFRKTDKAYEYDLEITGSKFNSLFNKKKHFHAFNN